jgi:hypothetical protein
MSAGFSLGKPGPKSAPVPDQPGPALCGQRTLTFCEAGELPCAIRTPRPRTDSKLCFAIERMKIMTHETIIKEDQTKAISMTPCVATAMDSMQRRVWHEQGVATFNVNEISDPWLRQAIINEAVHRWGQRSEARSKGR